MRKFVQLLALAVTLALWLGAAPRAAAADRPTDFSIESWVQDALRNDPRISTSEVKVSAAEGIVTLSGTVDSLTAKKYADLEAKKINGVQGVVNHLAVEPEERFDWDISQDVRHRLVNSAFIHSQNLGVSVIDGNVTLSGKVDSWAERNWAEMLAGEIRGVQSVSNDLTVQYESRRPDQEIANDVVASIARDAYLTGLSIHATVRDGIVTLTGSVGNSLQRDRARERTNWIAGVRGVHNELNVEWWKEQGVREKMPLPADLQLEKTVHEELYQDARVDPADVTVEASLGHVTLRGSVPSYFQKKFAGEDAGDVVGVSGVTNLVSVGATARSDSAINGEIVSNIRSDYLLNGQDISVEVLHGAVDLIGNVNRQYEKDHATSLASGVRGVTTVTNLLQINPPPKYTDEALEARIHDRLRENAETRWVADLIDVEVKDGKAILTGSVDFWSQWHEAQNVASTTDGISTVDNQIEVLTG